MKLDTKEFEAKMKKSIEAYKNELDTVRAGRANANVLSKITVDYYGSPTPVNQIGSVSIPDARTTASDKPRDGIDFFPLSIDYEEKMYAVGKIPGGFTRREGRPSEKAILASDIGITPANDGKVIRLVFPQLTEERRKELKKQVSKLGEDAKVAIRNIRRDAMDKSKDMKKNSEMTEDEQKISDKNVQDLTDKYIKEIDVITAAKEKEIMEI